MDDNAGFSLVIHARELIKDLPTVVAEERGGEVVILGWTRNPQDRDILKKALSLDKDALEGRVVYIKDVRTDDRLDGPAYELDFDTVADTWITVKAPFRDFAPTFRGRRLHNMPALDGANVRQIGFMIADKQEGPFRLKIDWIRAYEGAT